MRALTAIVVLALTAACAGDPKGDLLPAGTYAGSTKADQPVVLEVGDKVKINKTEYKPKEEGVFELKRGAFVSTLACKVQGKKAEALRCTVTFTAPKAPTVTEVIDLMLL